MPYPTASDGSYEDIWQSVPQIIRDYYDSHPLYERLCAEVSYILTRALREKSVEIAHITARAKSLNSIVRNMQRDNVHESKDLTDLAGVRVVYLYLSDFPSIEDVIVNHFNVLEKEDKMQEKGPAEFGYGAIHFQVKLSPTSSGARYDDLKDLCCEIQCRTVGQDAWGVISRHLVYDRIAEVPSKLLRKLNSLAAIFENADNQFDTLRTERIAYLQEVQEEMTDKRGGDWELNLDSLTIYLAKRFSMNEKSIDRQYLRMILHVLNSTKYRTVGDIEEVLEKTNERVNQFITSAGLTALNPANWLGIALAIFDNEYRKTNLAYSWDSSTLKQIEELAAEGPSYE